MGRKLALVAGTKPQLRETSKRNWTKKKQVAFLSALAETCNVTRAAKQAGVCASYAYKKRASDAKFRAGWVGAVEVG